MLYSLDGTSQEIPFSLPAGSIEGMAYSPATQILVFYTSSSIYLSNLTK